ncbi:restriction endonuclease [Clostridium novyi A str. 4552]|uniref:Restriction endonuclease n=1 Tax=Clostridium novyi A str. 4552 TaxID=1444289 RepID=A0A0A0IBM4_CLONO|nr:restriction endonuclease [Clostridium novyi]KGM98312.1 restriction endonuclease [Clostridium novyi A str. 4552]
MIIIEAIKEILSKEETGLTSREIYQKIVDKNLYSFGAKDPKAIVNGIIRKHCLGIDFPTASPVKHFRVVKQTGHVNYYLLNKNNNKSLTIKEIKNNEKELLPEEKMMRAFNDHVINIKQQLIEEILDSDPAFFEQLVSDLLIKMGYGYDEYASKIVSGSNDSGIDCIIDEDKLGLDKINIQAKRYSQDNVVGRPVLQMFVGAMENVQKGVFITTSSFSKQALQYAEKQQQKNLKLIDGVMLAELMVKYEVGVTSIKSFNTYKIDKDYFSEG